MRRPISAGPGDPAEARGGPRGLRITSTAEAGRSGGAPLGTAAAGTGAVHWGRPYCIGPAHCGVGLRSRSALKCGPQSIAGALGFRRGGYFCYCPGFGLDQWLAAGGGKAKRTGLCPGYRPRRHFGDRRRSPRAALPIEPRRQRRRADEVAEHHRQLPALGSRAGRGPRCRDAGGGSGSGLQAGNRCQQLAAMAD